MKRGLVFATLAVLLLPFAAAANQELMSLQNDDGQWAIPGKNYSSTRYSSLGQVTTANVGKLKQVWTFSTGVLRGHEGQPLVVGNTMYMHRRIPNHVYALDLTQGGQPLKWKCTPKQDDRAVPVACCDVVNRGVELRRGQDLLQPARRPGHRARRRHGQGSLEDQERATRQGRDDDDGAARREGQVIVGVERRRDGRARLDRRARHQRRQAALAGVQHRARRGHQGRRRTSTRRIRTTASADMGTTTWPGEHVEDGGGTAWGWFSYDPELNLVYYWHRQPGPWNPDAAPGRQQVGATIFARDADTGEMMWALPADAARRVGLRRRQREHPRRPADRRARRARRSSTSTATASPTRWTATNGECCSAEPFVPMNWSTGVDLKTGPSDRSTRQAHQAGRGRSRTSARASRAERTSSPRRSRRGPELFYVPTNNLCMDFEAREVDVHRGHAVHRRATRRRSAGRGGYRGEFIAWDATTGKKVWGIKEPYPGVGRRARDRRAASSSTARSTAGSRRSNAQDRRGALEVQGRLGRRRQPDDLHRARRQAVRRDLLGHRRLVRPAGRGGPPVQRPVRPRWARWASPTRSGLDKVTTLGGTLHVFALD